MQIKFESMGSEQKKVPHSSINQGECWSFHPKSEVYLKTKEHDIAMSDGAELSHESRVANVFLREVTLVVSPLK